MTSKLIAEHRASSGYLVLNAPARRNALSLDMWAAIPDFIARLETDPHIRSIVVTGAGEHFAAGADISEFDAARATAEGADRYDAATRAATAAIARCAKPVIAAIRGTCYGGAMALAMACDLRLVREDARFCIPAAKLGIGYGAEGVAALVAKLGPALTAEILFTARTYTAGEALAAGLVHAVASGRDFEALVTRYTDMLAENAPLSIAAAKSAITAAVSRDPAARAEAERRMTACMDSADYREGRQAFLEKRKPRFEGR
jgi:enoyl-CoA hydratase/carnithine racemase